MTQRVLVTAGAAGIGKEIASAFVANGATVCVCDINAQALDRSVKDVPGLKTIVCDRTVKLFQLHHSAGAAIMDSLDEKQPMGAPAGPCNRAG
jgi:short-subunit dehydrogenase involved in D-alanine esterification of teichoic acids